MNNKKSRLIMQIPGFWDRNAYINKVQKNKVQVTVFAGGYSTIKKST